MGSNVFTLTEATTLTLRRMHYRYVRHFGTGMGLTWREAFQTNDRLGVESYSADNDVEFSWRAAEEGVAAPCHRHRSGRGHQSAAAS